MKITILLKDLILNPNQPVDARTLPPEQIREQLQAAYARIGDAVEVEVDADSATITFPGDDGSQQETEATFTQALSKAQQGRIEEAIAFHRQVLTKHPTHVPSRRNLALLLLEQGNAEEATDLLLDLVLLAPDDPWAFGLLGRHFATKGKPATAESYLRKALDLSPEDNHARINLATALVDREQTEEAQGLFLDVIQSDPSLPNPYFNLAAIVLESNPGEARTYLERMFSHADFSDRKHQPLLKQARELYLSLCAEAGPEESQALWIWVKSQHFQVMTSTGWKISITPNSSLGSTTAKLTELAPGNFQIDYNPASELLAPAMVARELERVLIRHQHPDARIEVRVPKQNTPLEQSVVDYAHELPETRFADIRLARKLDRIPPGVFVDIYLRTNEEKQALNKIKGMKGFPKTLLDLWAFCGAFSAFSADILCRPCTALMVRTGPG